MSLALDSFGQRPSFSDMHESAQPRVHATTVIAVRRDGAAAIAGDGQVSIGATVVKANARKVRKLGGGRVLTGFAGASADAFTLLDRFEAKLEAHRYNLTRAAVELAKEWRTDRFLRRLEAMLIVLDSSNMFLLSGTGDVIEPDEGVIAIGSGGSYALAAARALIAHTALDAAEIARESLRIAAQICVYTNEAIVVEELGA
jgi:ATP-dependent HslUV protease, peptidase subunit HslV